MAYDFVDINTRTTYLKNRLDSLSKAIQNSASFQTQEAYIAECNRVLRNFYKTISEPHFEYEEAMRDDTLSPSFNSTSSDDIEYDYNLFWQQLLDNLTVLFLEMENLEAMSIANYNFAMVELNDLVSRLKSVSSKLGDYILYSQNTLKDVLLVRDSFNNLTRVDSGSNLVADKECDINQEEGIITLPLIPENNKILSVEKEDITIDPTNQGVAGNNHEIGVVHNGEVLSISDNNPDTWFEYEKVVSKAAENVPPLILDISFNLKEPRVINHIVINPNNFGTKTVLSIEKIDTSTDGEVYTSIKDDIPIIGYEVEDEENVFRLAPATSKYAGQGVYTFTPRKAQYVRITLKQNEPYVISTTSGEKLRYAIGIRDIIFKALAFESKGELVSKPFTVTDEIKKVMLESTQTPVVDSELTNIKYFISHNDGTSWDRIQPKHIASLSGIESTVPEIINFNTSSSNSISTDTPITSIRLKIALEREDSNFVEGASSLAKTILTKSEVHGMPLSSPFTITLENPPIEEFGTSKVEVVDPMFGSMGIPESAYMLRDGSNTNEDVFYLPEEYKDIQAPWEKDTNGVKSQVPIENWLYVYVGGEQWSHTTSTDFSTEAGKTVYKITDTDQGKKLEFDSSGVAESPPDNSSIGVHFGPEQLFPSEENNAHLAQLAFKTSKTKEDFIIERYDEEVIGVEETITPGATRFNLANKNITKITKLGSYNVDYEADGGLRVKFLNGQSEFASDPNKFSLDEKNGILYLHGTLIAASIEYDYQPIVELSTNDWDWTTNSTSGKQRLHIKDTGWKTQEKELDLGVATEKHFNLLHLGVISGTVIPVATTNATIDIFGKPVPFVNGQIEFANASAETPQWSIDYKNGEVFLSHSQTFTSLKFTYSWAKYVAKYRIARDLKLNTDYTVDVPNKQVKIKDKEFFKYLETAHTTKSGRAAHYLVNYDYVAETRENIEELKDHFTPVVKDYMLKLLRSAGIF